MTTTNNKFSDSSKTIVAIAAQHNISRVALDNIADLLLRKLQTSLDIEQILTWFLSETAEVFGPMNCVLKTNQENYFLTENPRAHHKANYNLTLDGQELGKIEFSRSTRFDEYDLQSLESLLGCLVYPLRNGIHYKEAMNAAMSDALTGIANKRAFDYQIHREVSLTQRYGSKLSLAIFDIDYFKKINDTYGHACGDAVLKQVVKVINENCRDSDLLYRLGGEEFGLLLPKTDLYGAYVIAERVRQAVEKHEFIYEGIKISVTISIGLSSHRDFESKVNFIERADSALYSAKNNGRNKTAVSQDENSCNSDAVNS